jgi:N-acetylglutamate synthase-like GNAT family acetyltransferase
MMIRPADRQDIPWLLEQLRAFARFSATHHSLFPADESVATAIVDALIAAAREGAGVFLVAQGAQGERIGFIVGHLAPHPFNPRIKTLNELFWWVTPSHRGSSAGARLLDAFVGFGKRHADQVVLTLEHESPDLEAGFVRRGFRLKERTFLLEVPKAAPTQAVA